MNFKKFGLVWDIFKTFFFALEELRLEKLLLITFAFILEFDRAVVHKFFTKENFA